MILRRRNKNIKFIKQLSHISFFAILILSGSYGFSQNLLAEWPLNADSLPASQISGLQGGSFLKGSFLNSLVFSSSGATGKPWPTGNLDSTAFFQVSIAPNPGFEIKIQTLRFGERRSLTGPRVYEIRSSYKAQMESSNLLNRFEMPDNDSERTGDLQNLEIVVSSGDTLFLRWYAFQAESSAGSWRINDNTLKIEGLAYPEFTNDTSSVILTLPQTIVHSISSLTNTPQDAVEVFRFLISDAGTLDTLPTLVSKLIITNSLNNQTNDGFRFIGGAVLEQNHNPISCKSIDITEDKLIFEFDSNALTILNNHSDTLSLKVYLKKENLTDGAELGFTIPATGHQTGFYSNGSGFASHFPASVSSAIIPLEVLATNLKITAQEKQCEVNVPFTASLEACDANQNRDRDFQYLFTLQYESKTGTLNSASGLSQNMQEGFCQWTDLTFNQAVPFKISTLHPVLGNFSTDTIWCYSKIFENNFESGNLTGFMDTAHWIVSNTDAISGNYSLKHNLSDTSGTSRIRLQLPQFELKSGITRWQFILRNGDWDPTSSNRFRFWTMTNEAISGGINMGLNYDETDDAICLYQTDSNLIITQLTSGFYWDPNNACAFEIRLKPNQTWQMLFDTTLSFNNLIEAGTFHSDFSSNPIFNALEFQFSSTRAGKLRMDNLLVSQINTGPFIEKMEPSNDSIVLWLSEPANPINALAPSTLRLSDDNNIEIPISSRSYNPGLHTITLHIPNFQTGHYTLWVNHLTDTSGMWNEPQNLTFRFSNIPKTGTLVLSEIFADPNPSLGLPEHDFLEFYNASTNEINLEGTTILIGTKNICLPKYYLPANQYLILCSETAFAEYAGFGRALSVFGSNDLPAGGARILVKNIKGELIEAAEYSTSLFTSETSEGGYSLEKRNLTNPCAGKNNWTVSQNAIGGTPGSENSQSDINFPVNRIISALPNNTGQISLQLSSTIDSTLLNVPGLFWINNQEFQYSISKYDSTFFDEMVLQLQDPLNQSSIYTISATSILKDCIDKPFEDNEISFALSQNPLPGEISINEVLFNPISGGVDFVELYNNSEKYFNITGFSLTNQSFASATISENAKSLFLPGEYRIICPDLEQLCSVYLCQQDAAIQNTLPSLPDDEGSIVLKTKEGITIDSVHYDENMHYSELVSNEGVSLERINPDNLSTEKSNWHSAAETAGFATPGFQNSQYRETNESNSFFSLDPELFSPDNDGYYDQLNLIFTTDLPGYLCNIQVFDASGRFIQTIADQALLGTKSTFSWNGTNQAGKLVKAGIYIVFAEIYHPNGTVKRNKKTCVVAYKKD